MSVDDKKKNGLNKSAVDRLVEAAHGDASGVDEAQISSDKKESKLKNIPTWVKALFLKWWFVGAAVFFFLWGLGNYVTNQWNLILVFGLGTGVITDLLTNNLFRLLEGSDHEYNSYMLFEAKKLWTLFANIAYAMVVTIVIVNIYDLINLLIINANPDKYASTDVPLAVEPILYSLFYLLIDMIVIMSKNLVKKIRNNLKISKGGI